MISVETFAVDVFLFIYFFWAIWATASSLVFHDNKEKSDISRANISPKTQQLTPKQSSLLFQFWGELSL